MGPLAFVFALFVCKLQYSRFFEIGFLVYPRLSPQGAGPSSVRTPGLALFLLLEMISLNIAQAVLELTI